MVVTFASLKGGVGKTTLATMFAKYFARVDGRPVVVVDVDPQQGATSLLLGKGLRLADLQRTTADVLASEYAGGASIDVLLGAKMESPLISRVSLLPSAVKLARYEAADTPTDLLRAPLHKASQELRALMVVDAPPTVTLCMMCVYAADIVFVPLTMSHQSGYPTLNTLQVALCYERPIGGLVPTMIGQALWQEARVDAWRSALASSLLLAGRGIPVLPPFPYSPLAVRAGWLEGPIPERFEPALKALYDQVVRLTPSNCSLSGRSVCVAPVVGNCRVGEVVE